MKILVIGAYGTLHREEAIERGFREAGATVLGCKYGDILFNPSIINRIQFRIGFGPAFRKIEKKVRNDIRNFQPDVLFFRRPLEFKPGAIKRLKKETSALFVSYNNDDPFSKQYKRFAWVLLRKAIKEFDLHFAFRKKNIDEFYAAGAKKVFLWEPYYVPWLHKPHREINNNGKLLFAMHAENDMRKEAVLTLLKNKFTIDIHCWNWEAVFGKELLVEVNVKPPVWGEEYVNKLTSAMGVLCFFSKQNNDELTSRVFEIPASGGLLIAERTNRLTELFTDNKDVVLFSSIEELIDKCRFLAVNPEKVLELKANSLQKIRSGQFSVLDRCSMALKIFKESFI